MNNGSRGVWVQSGGEGATGAPDWGTACCGFGWGEPDQVSKNQSEENLGGKQL